MAIKVLHCIETIGAGGVEQRRLLLAKHLRKDQFEQQIICSYVLNDFDKLFEAEGIRVTAIQGLHQIFNLSYYWRLLKAVRQYKPDLIHGAVFEGVISAVVAGLVLKVPIIVIEETSDPQNRSWRGNFLIKIFSYFANYVVGISPSVVNYLSHKIHVPIQKLRLINNGVDVPEYPTKSDVESLKKSLEILPDDFILGSVGRLRDFHKRFSDLIKALELLKNKIPKLKLMIVGDGEDRRSLEELAVNLQIKDRIIFVGYQRNTALYYSCMNVFALASYMEGFGLVVVEAMFFKLPVVVTAVGGMKDIVIENETGLLVKKESPSDLALAIGRLYDDPGLRYKLGTQGFERAMREYSTEVYVNKVARLYLDANQRISTR